MGATDIPMPSGTTVCVFDCVDSTNAQAMRAMGEGINGPCWFLADSQSAGRGRRGNVWHSKSGNLYASLLLPVSCEPAKIPELSFVAALGVHDAIISVLGDLQAPPDLTLKWPNDILLGSEKIAGILLETTSTGNGITAVVIGCGINIAHCPEIPAKPTTCLARHGVSIKPAALLSQLAAAVEKRLSEWAQGHNFTAIREAWLARAAGLGNPMSVQRGVAELSGTFETIDANGALVLRLDNGTRQHISSGEISLSGGSE